MVLYIPYRALFAARTVNLLAAGRCISCEEDAWHITRGIPSCTITGQAAGTAALPCPARGTRSGNRPRGFAAEAAGSGRLYPEDGGKRTGPDAIENGFLEETRARCRMKFCNAPFGKTVFRAKKLP
ncbi:MAG: FAD-dependent oxidoreductase [Provencibacterium sp.]|nr:FAD-dependent oxidoreductase [Provencibacterium sp.]